MQNLPLTLTISLFVISGMIIISSIIYFTERDKRQWHALEFWLSNGAYFILTLITNNYSAIIVALPSILWLWRVRTLRNLLQSICKVKLFKSWHLWLLILSYVVSIIFAFMGFGFTYFTFPQALCVFIVIIEILFRCSKNLNYPKISIHHALLFFTVFLIVTHTLNYPFLRYQSAFASTGFSIVLLSNLLMAIILPSVTILELKFEQHQRLERIVEERSGLLISQAKLSALGEMTAGIAHEMNNPLGILLHRAHHLKNEVLKDNMQKDFLINGLNQIEATTLRMNQIIKSLKNFSSEKKNELMKMSSLGNIIEETLSYCRERMRINCIELKIDSYPKHDVECNPVLISQVILNLLNNSYDAILTQDEPWIHISFKELETKLQVIVTDSGTGIPVSIREKIMEPFFTTKSETGTGIGLSLSKTILEDHQGKLFLDATSKNSTFVIELPYRQKNLFDVV